MIAACRSTYMFHLSTQLLTKVNRSNCVKCLRLISDMKNPIVTVNQGKLRGAIEKLHDDSTYYSFKGIPYAQPPVGDLRFKAPLPPEPWHGVLDATEHRSISPQVETHTMKSLDGDENCLFLNVYTKSLEPNSKIPVMVYIHGGAYMNGSGDSSMYGPRFLLQHDVILVTLNYRLEVLGFLCLGIPEAAGNAGMKDQVAALRWVQNNIAQFGGDPGNVTIFGESAGGASVTYHMFSPMSKGLFHKVVAQSGVCTADWAVGVGPSERAFRAGKLLGSDTTDPQKLLTFLKNVPAEKLVSLTSKTLTSDEKHRGFPIHFAPVVEKKFSNSEVFLDKDPLKLLLEGKITSNVPLIAGYNSAEGLMISKTQLKKAAFYNKNPSYFVPREIALAVPEEKLKEFGDRIKTFYLGNKDFSSDTVIECADLMTDVHFTYDTLRFLHFTSLLSKSVFLYKFNCDTELNVYKQLLGYSSYKGACHVDEVFYIFGNETNRNAYEENEELRKLVYGITKLWTNFAKTGNPTPDNSLSVTWPQYSTMGKEYLSIEDQFSVQNYPDKERLQFWNKLYAEAGRPHIPKSNL